MFLIQINNLHYLHYLKTYSRDLEFMLFYNNNIVTNKTSEHLSKDNS